MMGSYTLLAKVISAALVSGFIEGYFAVDFHIRSCSITNNLNFYLMKMALILELVKIKFHLKLQCHLFLNFIVTTWPCD